MNDCPRLGKFFGGCKFKPRFSTGEPGLSADSINDILTTEFEEKPSFEEVSTLINDSCPQEYVRDICVRCGATVERPQ